MRFTFHTQCYLKGCLFRWHLFSSASKSTECIRAKVRDRTIEAACLSSRFNLYVRFDNLVWFGSVWGSCILHAVLPHGLFLSWVINQSCWFIRKSNQNIGQQSSTNTIIGIIQHKYIHTGRPNLLWIHLLHFNYNNLWPILRHNVNYRLGYTTCRSDRRYWDVLKCYRRIGQAFGEKIIAVIESFILFLFELVLWIETSAMVHSKEGEELRYTVLYSLPYVVSSGFWVSNSFRILLT
jgi:hypothetical protein